MKFGKLDSIDGVDLSLPKDHSVTKNSLKKGSGDVKIYQGGTMWNIPEWLGKIYPEKTRKLDFIKAYGKHFSTIELNATHYKIPTAEVLLKWKNEMPEDFVFCPKFPQTITHYRRFNNCEGITDEFLEVILLFENTLGSSFIQLPPHYSKNKAADLLRYLESLPRDMKFALEFRHESWFDGSNASEEVWTAMSELGIGSVITDTAGRRDAVHMRLTTPDCIVRFGGNELDQTDEQRLTEWVERIAKWKKQGLETFHLWMHQPGSLLTPETCRLFGKLVKEELDMTIKVPELLNNQASLF
ncbi:MAG: DUF72 domain-containing protein [Flavobacteriales bacterium]